MEGIKSTSNITSAKRKRTTSIPCMAAERGSVPLNPPGWNTSSPRWVGGGGTQAPTANSYQLLALFKTGFKGSGWPCRIEAALPPVGRVVLGVTGRNIADRELTREGLCLTPPTLFLLLHSRTAEAAPSSTSCMSSSKVQKTEPHASHAYGWPFNALISPQGL